MKKYSLILGAALCAGAIYIGQSSNSNTELTDVTLESVEALAGCEVSSNTSLNTGGCVAEIGGAGDICAAVSNPETKCWKSI